jgi:hypothetical protein
MWQAYEETLDRFSASNMGTHEADVFQFFGRQLGIAEGNISYLFPLRDKCADMRTQLSFFANTCATIAAARLDMELVDDGVSYGVLDQSGVFTFGVDKGIIASRFTKNLAARPGPPNEEPVIRAGRVITYPRILNLYKRAADRADDVALYVISCLVWHDVHAQERLDKSLAGIEAESGPNKVDPRSLESARILPRVRRDCLQALDDAMANPKRVLHRLLVPTVVSSKAFLKYFCNPYDSYPCSARLRKKLRNLISSMKEAHEV